uniref:Uncharacterized protein n=1 Tax=Zooxanthella nutricula TaxID=1333877 RepID=A0A7S2PR99_9DINO
MGSVSLRGSACLFVLMFLGMAASFATAVGLTYSQWVLFGVAIPVSIVNLGMTCRLAGIEFGAPALAVEQHTAEIIKAAPSLILEGVADFLWVQVEPALEFPVFIAQFVCHCVIGWNVRGAGLVVLALSHVLRASLTFGGLLPFDVRAVPHLAFTCAFCAFMCLWTKYLHDQRLFFLIGHLQIPAGVLLDWFIEWEEIGWKVGGPGMTLLFCYLVLLCQRRLRSLPPGLDAVKFIRLGYIRGDARCSGLLLRCQDMPAGAFGDVAKVMDLIPVTHRWLDRHTCDVQTPDFPMGLRLAAMRRALNTHFSLTRAEEPSLARRLRHALCRRAVGGWDAVVFFDFAGIPQVPRSEAEDNVFRRCLPHLGMLYSMFPTLILHEVIPGAHAYLESGWCFCEFQTAKLGRQLQKYSLEALRELGFASEAGSDRCDKWHADEVISTMEAELERKRFYYPSDADAVRSIIKTFALKRMLLEAIEGRDMETLRSVVARLHEDELAQSTLDQPVNAALETPLHVAVRMANALAAKVLLDNGANPSLRNLRGDTPGQCFMLRRWSRAARLMRATASPVKEVDETVQSVAI